MIKKMSKRSLNFIQFIDKLEDTENMFKNKIPIFSISIKRRKYRNCKELFN